MDIGLGLEFVLIAMENVTQGHGKMVNSNITNILY